jgi:hypothetical protein
MDSREISKIAENFKRDFGKLMKHNQELLNQLPAEYDQKKAEIQKDLETIMNSTNKQDESKINEILRKYGNLHSR